MTDTSPPPAGSPAVPRLRWRMACGACGAIAAIGVVWAYHGWSSGRFEWAEAPFGYAGHWRMELPLLAALILAGAWPAGRGAWAWFLGALAAAVPIGGLYASIDRFILVFARPPTFDDVELLPELLHADPWLGGAVLAGIGVLAAVPAIVFFMWWRQRSWRERLLALGARLLAGAGIAIALCWAPARAAWTARVGFYDWSDLHNVKDFGRFSACWEVSRRSRSAIERLAAQPAPVAPPDFPDTTPAPRNVYLVLLESFVDARDLAPEPALAGDPIHPDLHRALGGAAVFDRLSVPVFGGYSAQSEFALVTGAPALALAAPIDYQFLGRAPAPGLAARLSAAGWRTVVVYASGRYFFNAAGAHRSLGFGECHYADLDPWAQRHPDDRFMTDGDLFAGVLAHLPDRRDPRPTLTLIVGMEGHEPYPRDRARFPDRFTHPQAHVADLANLCWYRTRALAGLIDGLARSDPRALVLVSADHQPIAMDGIPNRIFRYQVPALLLDAGRPVPLGGRAIHSVAWLIWERLTSAPAPVPGDAELQKRYEAVIGAQLRGR